MRVVSEQTFPGGGFGHGPSVASTRTACCQPHNCHDLAVRGRVGPITRKKRAPREYPIEPELAAVLREHRRDLLRRQAPGLAGGWMFPSPKLGTLRICKVPGGGWHTPQLHHPRDALHFHGPDPARRR
jgi:hypothetical protein